MVDLGGPGSPEAEVEVDVSLGADQHYVKPSIHTQTQIKRAVGT